jgi:hypothetical protein
MLSGIINAACEGGAGHDLAGHINDALAAATGIGARDEIEGMVAVQMIATHVAAITVLRQLKGSAPCHGPITAVVFSSIRAQISVAALRQD